MSETYVLRLFTTDRDATGRPGGEYRPDGRLHGTIARVQTGRRLPFRDDAGLIAALLELAADDPSRLAEAAGASAGASPGAGEVHGTV